MVIIHMIRNECSEPHLLLAKGFWTSDNIENDNDTCERNDVMPVKELSNNIFNRLPQECKVSEDLIGSVPSCEYKANIHGNEYMMREGKESESLLNPPSQLCEQPVRDVYVYSSSDDSSVSTLGSLSSLPLPQVVSSKISRLKGSWNDEKIVTLLCQANWISRRVVNDDVCGIKDIMHADNLSKKIINRQSQECKQSEQDPRGNGSSGEYGDMMHEEKESENLLNSLSQLHELPLRNIYLYPNTSDDSSISTLGFLSSLPPKVVSQKIPRLKGSWNDEKIVTLLCPAVSQ